MSKVNLFLSGLAVLGVAVVLTGCSGGEDTAPATAVQGSEAGHDSADHDHADHDHADHDGADHDGADHDGADHDHAAPAERADATPAIKEALAQLSEEDRTAAESQKICPVTGGALGSMGKPCKVTVTTGAGEERTVFLCCAGCESEIKENPDKHLAKLAK